METKRECFSRFYFLDDTSLLEILSETKNPVKVQPHLKKLFENINTVDFNEQKMILSMNSSAKENVLFTTPIDPNIKNVEFWMGDVESEMFGAVKREFG